MADLSPDEFAASVLDGIGVRQTPGAMKALKGWIQAEGGHWNNQARYNPLNTTQGMPGAGNTGSQGNIKVYRNWRQGIDATIKTLTNGRYKGIISALGRGDAAGVAAAIGASPWGTSGDLVSKTIGGATGGTATPPEEGSGGTSAQSVTTHAPMQVPDWQGASEAADPVNLAMDFLHKKIDVISFVKAIQAANAAEPWNASSMAPTEGDTVTTYSSGEGGDSSPSSGAGAFEISGPNPDRLQPHLVSFARKVAGILGQPLVGLDGSTHSKMTVNGNVSQHYTGNATDIFTINGKPARGQTLLRAGRAALLAAGMPREQAMRAQGGLYNVGSHQIIFLTNEGGNHFDHLHVSAR